MRIATLNTTIVKLVAIIAFTFLSSIPVGVLTRDLSVTVALAAPVSAERLVELTNEARVANGLAPLVVNDLLVRSAQGKSDDMLTKGYFAHTSPEGLSPWYWFRLVGYDYLYAGENLAKNFATAEETFSAWMNSPSHRANILSPNFKEIGVAVAADSSVLYITQHFGTRRAGAAPATVVRTPASQTRGRSSLTAQAPAPKDTTPPVIVSTRQAHGTLKQGGTIRLALRVEGDPVSVTVTVGRKQVDLRRDEERWVGELVVYAGGTHDITVTAADSAGNTARSVIGTVTVELPGDTFKPGGSTVVAGYLLDVARHEAAPISLALLLGALLVLGWAVAGHAVKRLEGRVAGLVFLPTILNSRT